MGTEASLENWSVNTDPTEYDTDVNKSDSCEHDTNKCHSLAGSLDSSEECQKKNFIRQNCFYSQMPQFAYKKTEEQVDLMEPIGASDIVDVSMFDVSNTTDLDSDAETLKNSSNEMGEKSACRTLGLQTKEI